MTSSTHLSVHLLTASGWYIISFSIKEMDPDLLVSQMSKWGINISTTSSVSTPYDMQQRNIQLMNRLGIHYYNTESEIDHFLECLQKIGK